MNFFKPNFWDKNRISFFPIFLLPFSLIVRFLFLFKKLISKEQKFSIPVICVGNIYLGGTGKTPISIEIFSIVKKLNFQPIFIRKKYKSYKDEVDLLELRGTVYQNKKRGKAINEAAKKKFDVAILDDGFQDFSIKKDLSILCFNEKQWIGNGLTIPSGPLRENLSALKRANCIIINGEKNQDIEKIIFEKNKNLKIFYAKYKSKKIDEFQNKRVIAFAGIGNPENFFSFLIENKINLLEKIKFPDHYQYSEKDLKNLSNKAKENNCSLLTTEKDYLRIPDPMKKNINFLKIEVEIDNRNEFIEEIKKII